MDKNQEIALAIKNGDINRKNFFIKRLAEDLKKSQLIVDEDKLENLFMDEVNTFLENNNTSTFYFCCLGNIRKILEKENGITFVSNELFSRDEMRIISLYLNIENAIMPSEGIAKKLGIPITDVTKTVSKAKTYYSQNRNQINKLFPNFVEVIAKRQNLRPGRKNKIKTIKRQDIELIGYFTGQINDTCLDIEDLAKKFYSSKGAIELQLKDFILSLKDQSIYSILLREYPNIEEMLVIRANTLGIKPKDFLEKNIASKYKEVKENSKSQTNQTTTKSMKNLILPGNINYNKVKKYVDFFHDIYTKKEDGTYKSLSELAKKYNVTKQAISVKKNKYLKNLDKNKQLKDAILKMYPTLLDDKIKYEQSKNANNAISLDDIDEVVNFCKNIFTTKRNGRFLNYASIARLYNIPYSLFISKKNAIYLKLENNQEFKTKVLEKYPQVIKR